MSTAIDTNTDPQKLTANEITIVDRRGKPRIHLLVEEDGTAALKFLDGNERLRMALYLKELDDNDGDFPLEDGSDNISGLLVIGRQSGATIQLGISEDGFLGKRARLEIKEGTARGKQRHRFPPRPPSTSD